MSNTPVAGTQNTPETVATQLARDGAILNLNAKGQRFLVGYLVWLGPRRIFCFAANGNDPKEDGHLLAFDAAQIERPPAITFFRKGREVARLAAINDSGVDDAEDLRAAWGVWQQRRPACERLIGASLMYYVTNIGLR